ncbi:MAG: hypothetical protein IPL28_11030 [Chloroflexi bacterium]|nr:hypothetical protein [Chloroflexota bacterium]
MHRFLTLLILLTALFSVACQPALLNPPRLATAEAQAATAGTIAPTRTPLFLPAPTPTGGAINQPVGTAAPIPTVRPNPRLTLWVNETEAIYREVLAEMAAELQTDYGIDLEYLFVDPNRLPDLVASASISDTLPDLILHPLQYSTGWAAQGILSPEMATAALDQLGRDTFDAGALQLVGVGGEGQIAALPSDGWQQIWLYRTDWYEALDLAPPTSYTAILTAAQTIYQSAEISAQTGVSNTLISGLVVPTEAELYTTQFVFEQLAVANGCDLVSPEGEITFIHPDCLDALDFYRDLVNGYSPSDVQTDLSALNTYLAGRTGMIVTLPTVLPRLLGQDERFLPSCPQCRADPLFLAQNSGIVTVVEGRGPNAQAANFGQIINLGISRTADEALALQFADYWFNAGYLKWLAVEPARRVPMRLGTAADPVAFQQAWQALPITSAGQTIADVFGAEAAEQLVADITSTPRWGFAQGQGPLITTIATKKVFPIILQEMLSGYFTSSQAVIEAYNRVVALIPNYAYDNAADE